MFYCGPVPGDLDSVQILMKSGKGECNCYSITCVILFFIEILVTVLMVMFFVCNLLTFIMIFPFGASATPFWVECARVHQKTQFLNFDMAGC